MKVRMFQVMANLSWAIAQLNSLNSYPVLINMYQKMINQNTIVTMAVQFN